MLLSQKPSLNLSICVGTVSHFFCPVLTHYLRSRSPIWFVAQKILPLRLYDPLQFPPASTNSTVKREKETHQRKIIKIPHSNLFSSLPLWRRVSVELNHQSKSSSSKEHLLPFTGQLFILLLVHDTQNKRQ